MGVNKGLLERMASRAVFIGHNDGFWGYKFGQGEGAGIVKVRDSPWPELQVVRTCAEFYNLDDGLSLQDEAMQEQFWNLFYKRKPKEIDPKRLAAMMVYFWLSAENLMAVAGKCCEERNWNYTTKEFAINLADALNRTHEAYGVYSNKELKDMADVVLRIYDPNVLQQAMDLIEQHRHAHVLDQPMLWDDAVILKGKLQQELKETKHPQAQQSLRRTLWELERFTCMMDYLYRGESGRVCRILWRGAGNYYLQGNAYVKVSFGGTHSDSPRNLRNRMAHEHDEQMDFIRANLPQ